MDDSDRPDDVTLVLACAEPPAAEAAALFLQGECAQLRGAGFFNVHVTAGVYGDNIVAVENLTLPGAACSISRHGEALERAVAPPP